MPQLRLTKQSVAALIVPPGKADALYFDTELKGFGVKASAGGSRQFIVQYRPRGGGRNPKRLTIGPVGTLTIDEARREARLVLGKASTGVDPRAEKTAAKADANVTLGGVADRYLSYAEERQKPGTFYQTKLHLMKHWAPLRPLPLSKVRLPEVASRLTELAKVSGGVSANRSRSALSALFAWAIGEGITEANPVVGTRKPGVEKPRERVLTDNELACVWDACGEDSYGRIVQLLMLTGQRREEVGGMVDQELQLDNVLWTLPAARSKNRREQIVPLSDPAVSILRQAPRFAGRDFVFGEGRGGYSGWSRSKVRLDARIAALGVSMTDWTLHDLRRTMATTMADRLGVLPHIIEAVLNHVSGHKAGVAGVYNRASYLAEKRIALDAWAKHIETLVDAGNGTSFIKN